jgi:autoinducer 2-degrading protein
MYVVCVTIWVKAEFAEQFLAASLENARDTRVEPGNLRFDISRGADDPTRFFFYEAYHDEEVFRAHQQTAHYFTWRDTVNDWMAQPRQGVRYQGLFPASEAGWRAE